MITPLTSHQPQMNYGAAHSSRPLSHPPYALLAQAWPVLAGRHTHTHTRSLKGKVGHHDGQRVSGQHEEGVHERVPRLLHCRCTHQLAHPVDHRAASGLPEPALRGARGQQRLDHQGRSLVQRARGELELGVKVEVHLASDGVHGALQPLRLNRNVEGGRDGDTKDGRCLPAQGRDDQAVSVKLHAHDALPLVSHCGPAASAQRVVRKHGVDRHRKLAVLLCPQLDPPDSGCVNGDGPA
mmetsp:Transcript_7349/g.18235  ORF Transcript_7349/g.18235 Transcript_7349/m.18235 type:complete len:239 (+) Transcript_7349:214-930(+)